MIDPDLLIESVLNAVRLEAVGSCDFDTVHLCDRALDGSRPALRAILRQIVEAAKVETWKLTA